MHSTRRATLRLLGGGALAAGGLPVLSMTAAAQSDDLVVTNNYQNHKRGTIDGLHPDRRILNVTWEDRGRVKMRAADLVTNYSSLKDGQIVDCNWFDYVDFLIAKKTPETQAKAKAMVAQGARLEGIPGARQRINLWTMEGMVTKVDLPTNTVFLINAIGNQTDEPPPNDGEVIQMPQIVTPAGKAALQTIKPGDVITTVFSQQTAIDATIIR